MIITEESIYNIPENEQGLVVALLNDIAEINDHTHSNLKLEWIDEHTEWSPERVDPCPDYYGMYRVLRGNDYIGVEMTLDDLDIALCLLHNYLINL